MAEYIYILKREQAWYEDAMTGPTIEHNEGCFFDEAAAAEYANALLASAGRTEMFSAEEIKEGRTRTIFWKEDDSLFFERVKVLS